MHYRYDNQEPSNEPQVVGKHPKEKAIKRSGKPPRRQPVSKKGSCKKG